MKRLVKEISRRAFDLELVYSQRSDYMRYHEEFERYPPDQSEAGNPEQREAEDSDVALFQSVTSPYTVSEVFTHPNDPAD
jgi:hypothetical protein